MQGETLMGQQSNKRLFRLMKEALAKAKTLGKECIFLTGEIRSGKSTTFNWISNPNVLIGADNEHKPNYTIQQKNIVNSSYAQVKNSCVSVTLIPNIVNIGQGKVCLIDLPGNKDRRGEVEVIMVSFIMSTCFKYTQNAKFIIVLSQNGFQATDGTQFINAISSFVGLFASTQIEDKDLETIFDSVSLLLTAVPISPGKYEDSKQYYIKRLKQYIPKLQQLQEKNKKLNRIFPKFVKLIENILKNKRMQLFPRAQFGTKPNKSNIIETFQASGWKSVSLQQFYERLTFPYDLHFQQLQQEQKQSLYKMINSKISQYEKLSQFLGKLIQKFVQNPVCVDEEALQSLFNELESFLKQSSIQEYQILEEEIYPQRNYSSIVIIKTLLLLNQIILYDSDRSQESRKNKAYFQYLQQNFQVSIQRMKQCFARTQRHTKIFEKICSIYNEGFEYFNFICHIEKSIYSQAQHRMKEACCIMNLVCQTDFQLKDIYFRKLAEQQLYKEQFQLEEIVEMIKFIEGQKPEDYEVGRVYQILYKCYQFCGQKYRYERSQSGRPDLKSALQNFMYSLLNTIKTGCIYNILLKNEKQDAEQLKKKMDGLKHWQERIYRDIKELIYEVDQPQQIVILESYLQFCQKNNRIQDSLSVIDKILKLRIPNRGINQYYRTKKTQLQLRNHKQSDNNYRQQLKDQQQVKYLSIINFLLTFLFKLKQPITLQQIQKAAQQLYKTKEQQLQHKNQFNIDLPPHLTNYQALAFSRHLISKIKNRKTIILLGKKTGKSTACYWLRGKDLVLRGNYVALPASSKEPNKIIDNLLSHTEVPNVYSIGEDEVLVDCPHIYLRDPEKMIVAGAVKKQLIESSSECKFLLVVKESDIVQNQGKQLLEMIIDYINMWSLEMLKQTLKNCLMLLVTFKNPNSNITKVRQAIKTLKQEFEKKENLQILEEKFKLGIDQQTQKQIFVIINNILQNGLYKYVDLEDLEYKKQCKMIGKLHQNWKYAPLQKSNASFLNLKHFFPIHRLKRSQRQNLISNVQSNIKSIKAIGNNICQIFQCYIRQYLSTNNLIEDKLEALIQPQMIQTTQRLAKNNQLKVILYPCLSDLKFTQNKAVRNLLTCLLINEIMYLTNQLSISFHQQNTEPFYNICLKILDRAANILGDRSNVSLYEACRLKVYEGLQMWKLYEFALRGQDQYGQINSGRVTIPDSYQIAYKIENWSTFISLQTEILNLEQLRAQPKKQQLLRYLYQYLTNIKKIIHILKQFQIRQFAQKLQYAYHFFLQYSSDDRQCLQVLVQQAQTTILVVKFQRELMAKLIIIVEKILIKMVSLDSKLAFTMADTFKNGKIKAQMFERSFQVVNPTEKRVLLHQYLQWAMNIGLRTIQILQVLTRHQHLLSQQETEIYKQRIFNNPQRQQIQQRHSLQQLKEYIGNSKKMLQKLAFANDTI